MSPAKGSYHVRLVDAVSRSRRHNASDQGPAPGRANLGNLGLACPEKRKNLSYRRRFTDPFQGDVSLVA
jgi:hypothetical protein